MIEMGSILVTGAGGFIGGHLISSLRESNVGKIRAVDIKPVDDWFQVFRDVETLQLDLRDRTSCRLAVRSADWIFNFAADMGGMGFIETHKTACMLSSLINTHLLMAAQEQGAERYFYASSACVYAAGKQSSPDVTGLSEEDAYPAMPEDGYGWEKLFGERMCRHFHEDFGLEARMARYHNVYGPLGTWQGGREKAPAAICRKVIEAKMSGDHEIEIWGDGQQTRSFTYIDDAIEGTLRIMRSGFSGPLNLGSEQLVTINQLVDIAERLAGIRLRRRYDLSAPQGVRGRNSDNRLIRSVIGWAPSTSLEDGLEQTYRWIYDEICGRAAHPSSNPTRA
jgi:GDP-D-mannose 3', 5'-epimerase